MKKSTKDKRHEWRYEQMETALRVIYTWASAAVDSGMDYVAMEDMRDIRNKAYEALHLEETETRQ